MDPDPRIIRFIRKHHILTLATASETQPWCCSCFYAYDPSEHIFIFTSEEETRHVSEIRLNHRVSGNIVLETRIIGKIQGLQFSGEVLEVAENDEIKLRAQYFKRFPYARPFIGKALFWKLRPDYMKFTDNSLGFGVKLQWKR